MAVDVVVVIPCKNEATRLPRQLDALNNQSDRDFRVVISDNGSTDTTALIAANWAATFTGGIDVVDSSSLPGVAHARNVAIRATNEPLILVCDGDDRVHPGWVAAMRNALTDSSAATGPLHLVFPDNPERAETWNASSVPVSMNFRPYMPGCNMGFRRGVFDAVDGFDEALSTGQEDVDFGWRIKEAGFEIAHNPRAQIDYLQRADLSSYLKQQWRYGKAHAILYVKHQEAEGIPAAASVKTSIRWFIEWAKQLPLRIKKRESRGALGVAVFQLGRLSQSLRIGKSAL